MFAAYTLVEGITWFLFSLRKSSDLLGIMRLLQKLLDIAKNVLPSS